MPELLSKYRSQIMAFAILGTLATHSEVNWGFFPLNRFFMLGFGGVDIFFFLSGFGLYVSMARDSRTSAFYRKRLVRIMPVFILILLGTKLFNGSFTWQSFLKLGSTLGFWFPRQWGWSYFAWFISGMIALYLIFPLHFHAIRKSPAIATSVLSAVGLLGVGISIYVFFVTWPNSYNGQMLFWSRVPIFAIGVLFGFYYSSGKTVRHPWLYIAIAIAVFVVYNVYILTFPYRFLYKTSLLFLPWCLMIPGFCYLLAVALDKINSRRLNRLLALIGGATLEAYLLINPVFACSKDFIAFFGGNALVGRLTMMTGTIILAIIIHRLMKVRITHHLRPGLLRRCVRDRL